MLIDHSKLAPTLKFYATALPLKVYGLFIFILLSVGVGLILWAHGMGDSDFTIFMTLAACVFIGPCLAICLFRAVRQFKLYKSGEIILEFGSDEMRCNSKISGPIGTIEWPDVVGFHPVIAMASPYAMIMIERIDRPTFHEAKKYI